jgi:hypothetical protein
MLSDDDYHGEDSTDDDGVAAAAVTAARAAKTTAGSDVAGGGADVTRVKTEAETSDAGGALARALANDGVSGSSSASLDALRAMYDSFGLAGGGGPGGSAAAANRFAESLAQSMFADPYGGGGGGLFGRPSGGQQARMRTMLTSLRSKSMSTQLAALQEASEFLSISTEDTLSGYFDLDGFIKEFIRILKGEPYIAPGGGGAGAGGRAISASAATVDPPAAAAATKTASDDKEDDAQPHRSDGDDDHDSEDDHDDDDDDDEDDESDGNEGAGGGEALHAGPHASAADFGGEMMDDDDFEDAELMRILALSAQEARQAEQAAAGGGRGSGGGGNPATSGGSAQAEPASFSAGAFGLMAEEPSAEKLEAQLLACRCLANLMEALPGSAHTVVSHGAVPVLCAKLLEIQYIDLAEQTLSVRPGRAPPSCPSHLPCS